MNMDEVPYNYAHCYATDEECSQCVNCLRHKAAVMNEMTIPQPHEIISCITSAYIKRVADGKVCDYFRSDVPVRYARGMKRIFDDVPKGRYNDIRLRVIECFSSERVFYYAQKGEQLIPPVQQEKISELFLSEGLKAPTFDNYELHPDW